MPWISLFKDNACVCREGKLTIEEHRETGSLKRGVLLQYFSAIGIWKCLALLAALTGGQAALVTSEWWLTTWAQSSPDSQSEDIGKWIVVYSALVAGESARAVLYACPVRPYVVHALCAWPLCMATLCMAPLRSSKPLGRSLGLKCRYITVAT